MEQLCYFVCSRGIMKSCTFHSLKPISSSTKNNKYLSYMLKSGRMFDGMSIYVCSDLLPYFINIILPKIRNYFTLVSGDSDLCVPLEILSNNELTNITQNKYLIKWFVQNTRFQSHEKIVQLPIGLDYHTISNNPSCSWKKEGERHLPRFQEEILINIRQIMKPFYERVPKIYVNFSIGNDRFGQRKELFEKIPNDLMVIKQDFMKRTDAWNNITTYSFVASPFGNGMDCHRTWEALCLGSIPILKSPSFKKLFEGLPVLIVKDWSDINEELLINTLDSFKEHQFDYNKLTLAYWVKRINNKIL